MKYRLVFLVLVITAKSLFSQVAINETGNNADNSAVLDVQSASKGMLIPRLTDEQLNNISNPATGLLVYVTDHNKFYYYNGTEWIAISTSWIASGDDIYSGNQGFVGIGTNTPSAKLHVFTQSSQTNYTSDMCSGGIASASAYNSGNIPDYAFDDNTTAYRENNGSLPSWLSYDFGENNEKTIVRYRLYFEGTSFDHSPKSWLFQASNDANSWTTVDARYDEIWISNNWKEYDITNTTPYRYYRINILNNRGTSDNFVSINEMEMLESYITMVDDNTLVVNEGRVGIGTLTPSSKLHVNGGFRLEDGSQGIGKILLSDIDGNASWTSQSNIDDGDWNVTGNYIYTFLTDSVGIGVVTPSSNLDIYGRIWISNTGHSVFIGENAGAGDDFTNNQNIFIGYNSGQYDTTGYYNTAVGAYSLQNNVSGYANTAFGDSALIENISGYGNTAVGANISFLETGFFNSTALGYQTSITASNQIRFGNPDVTSIGGYVNYSTLSDERFKYDVRENIPGLDFILKLRPVTYYLDVKKLNNLLKRRGLFAKDTVLPKILRTGFIAQEVEQAAKSVGYDFSGVDAPKNENDHYGLRYAEFVVPLVKAVQEQQNTIEQLEKKIDYLEKTILEMNNRLKEK